MDPTRWQTTNWWTGSTPEWELGGGTVANPTKLPSIFSNQQESTLKRPFGTVSGTPVFKILF